MSYPKLRKENIIDIHGFPDPYQWIEKKLDSDEVIKWIKDQNSISNSFLAIPLRERIRTRLNALYNYEKYSAPFKYGDNYFFYHNSGLQNQEVLYMQETLESKPEVVLDPNTLSEDGTVALDSANFSDDGQFLAYSVSKCGTDWTTCYVKNMKTKEDFGEKLEWLKFTSFEWTRDNLGFFYVRFPEQKNIKEEDRGKEVSLNNNQKVYYHKLGTPQENDILIYQELENPNYFIYPSVSRVIFLFLF